MLIFKSQGLEGVDRGILSRLLLITYFRKDLLKNTCSWAVLVGSQTFEKISKVSKVQLERYSNPFLSTKANAGLN